MKPNKTKWTERIWKKQKQMKLGETKLNQQK